MQNDSNLFFTCSLIEYMSREKKLHRGDAVKKVVRRIYEYADVLHCEPIAAVADEYERMFFPQEGNYDNVSACRYDVPDYWTIGKVFSRLVEDVNENDPVETLQQVYTSWISDAISNYNSDLFYQPRDYLRECCSTQGNFSTYRNSTVKEGLFSQRVAWNGEKGTEHEGISCKRYRISSGACPYQRVHQSNSERKQSCVG